MASDEGLKIELAVVDTKEFQSRMQRVIDAIQYEQMLAVRACKFYSYVGMACMVIATFALALSR
jgi:hypothetical protein